MRYLDLIFLDIVALLWLLLAHAKFIHQIPGLLTKARRRAIIPSRDASRIPVRQQPLVVIIALGPTTTTTTQRSIIDPPPLSAPLLPSEGLLASAQARKPSLALLPAAEELLALPAQHLVDDPVGLVSELRRRVRYGRLVPRFPVVPQPRDRCADERQRFALYVRFVCLLV